MSHPATVNLGRRIPRSRRAALKQATPLFVLALAFLSSIAAPSPAHAETNLKRQFPNMKFAPGKRQCLAHLTPYIRHLHQQERHFNGRAKKLGIASSQRWQEAAVHWRKRREIWTRASYCWPCFDRSDLVRDWREALTDRNTADGARRVAAAALARMEDGSVAYLHADLAHAHAGADQMGATARRGFFGCLLGKTKPGG